jgi:flagellar basal body-associated protein FliL
MSEKKDESSPARTGPSMVQMLIVGLVTALVGGAVSGAAVSFLAPHPAPAAAADAEAGGHGGEASGEGGHGEDQGPSPPPEVLSLEPFIVNLADLDRDRYLKATLKVTVATQELLVKVRDDPARLARVRDTVIATLSSCTSVQLRSAEEREALRERLRAAIENAASVHDHAVTGVFFTEFVTQ